MKNEIVKAQNTNTTYERYSDASKNKKDAIRLLLITLGVLIITAVGVGASIYVKNESGELVKKTVASADENTPESIIEGKVRRLGLVETVSTTYTHVSTMSESKQWFGISIPGSSNTFVITVEGKITVGVDMSKATVSYDEEKGEYKVKLPRAQVMSNELDDDSWKYFDEKSDTFKSLSVDDTDDAYTQVESKEEEKAIDNGILDEAQRIAGALVISYLSGIDVVGDNKITVVFGAK